MCNWRYGFLRCDAGFLHGKDAPAWAKWCPRCNGPTLVKEARDVSLVAFQQAMALCADEQVGEVRAWLRFAEWPVTISTGVGGEPSELTQQEAEALWNDALAAAPRLNTDMDHIQIVSVANELESLRLVLTRNKVGDNIDEIIPWVAEQLAQCRNRLATLTRPKELT